MNNGNAINHKVLFYLLALRCKNLSLSLNIHIYTKLFSEILSHVTKN